MSVFREKKPATAFSKANAPDRSHLPGYDKFMHESKVVDEFVEPKDGKLVVVYRTKPEISRAAQLLHEQN